MITTYFLLIFTILLTSCASPNRGLNYLSSMKSIELGSSKLQVKKKLGEPDKVETDQAFTQLTYSIPYRSLKVPKVIFWFDSNDKLVTKYINLFPENRDNFSLEQTENQLGQLDLVEKQLTVKSGHQLASAMKELIDEKRGISLIVNSVRNNEVESITWTANPQSDQSTKAIGSK
jgi:hypothetical protein